MCLDGQNLTPNALVTNCPHVTPRFQRRINFCGCCLHRMCDLCTAIHPMPTKAQEKGIVFPCHLNTRNEYIFREQKMETDLLARYHAPVEPTEYHIQTIV